MPFFNRRKNCIIWEVDLGGTTIKAGLFDEQLQLLKMVQKNTGASLGADIVFKKELKNVLRNNLSFKE